MQLKCLFVCLFCAVISIRSFTQETTSEIQGAVSDEKGALAGATVLAVHTPTGTRYATSTRKDGLYNLPNLRVGGPYEIAVTYVGYSEDKKSDILLSLGQIFKADFKLLPSTTALTEIVVTGASQNKVFSRNRTGSSETITRQQIDRLPTIGRSINDFTRLTPTANSGAQYGSSSFAGRSFSYNSLTVNGANFNNTFGLAAGLGGQTNSQPISLDALDQIQVTIAPYDVTLGGFTGAGINSVTKSGTNEFKATLYNYTKSPGLTGRKVGTTTILKQQFDFSNRGASLGGPIIRNKLFFFISGEQERDSRPATSLVASRNGSTGNGVSQAKAEDLELLSKFLQEKYNYATGPFENYNYKTSSDKITARIDWNINKKNTLNINYYYLKSSRNVPPSNSGAPNNSRQPGNTSLPFFSSSYIINNNFNIVIAELNTRFSNRFSNKIQAGYNQLRDFRSSPGGIFPLVDIEDGNGRSFTAFGYEPFTAFNSLNTDTYQFNDIFTWYQGKHTIIFGTQNSYNKFRNGFAPNYYGAYRFRNLQDFYNSATKDSTNATRYELRYSARPGGEFPYAYVGALQLGFFAQDKWNVSDDLVLTLGLRADIPMYDNKFVSNRYADSLTFRNGARIKTGEGPKASVLWSPRIGFNWDVKGDKSTQVRGGVGIFTGPTPFVWISNQASNNGVDFGSFVTNRVAFKPDVNANRPTNAKANTSYNLAVTDKDFKFPQLFRSNIAIDYKFPFDIIGTFEAIYSRDINAVYHTNINLPSAGTPLSGSDKRIRYTSSKIYSGGGGESERNPNISDAILMANTSKGYTYSLTTQLQRNVKGLYTMIAYTFSDSRSVNDGGSIAQSIWRDRTVTGDPNENITSYSNFYQPHRVIAAASYRKEYAKFFATSIGFTFEAANGGTYTYTYNGDVNNDGLTSNDLIYVPKDQSDIMIESIDATDLRTPAVIWGQLDNYIKQDPYLSHRRGMYAERNGLLTPFYKRLDLNITQDFFLSVRGKRNTIRLTMDVFNFGNLLNKNWGTYRIPYATTILNFKRVDAATGKPVFTMPYLDRTNQIPLTNSFQNSTSINSRYQAQVGVRYIFN